MSWYPTICLSRILLELLAVNKVVLQQWIIFSEWPAITWRKLRLGLHQGDLNFFQRCGEFNLLGRSQSLMFPLLPLTSPMKYKRHCGIPNSTLYPAQSKQTLKKPSSANLVTVSHAMTQSESTSKLFAKVQILDLWGQPEERHPFAALAQRISEMLQCCDPPPLTSCSFQTRRDFCEFFHLWDVRAQLF